MFCLICIFSYWSCGRCWVIVSPSLSGARIVCPCGILPENLPFVRRASKVNRNLSAGRMHMAVTRDLSVGPGCLLERWGHDTTPALIYIPGEIHYMAASYRCTDVHSLRPRRHLRLWGCGQAGLRGANETGCADCRSKIAWSNRPYWLVRKGFGIPKESFSSNFPVPPSLAGEATIESSFIQIIRVNPSVLENSFRLVLNIQ